MVRKRPSLAQVVVRQVGWRSAPRVLGLIAAWGAFVKLKGRSPTMLELAGANKGRSQAQWYRDLEAFERAFPEEKSPDRIARWLLRRVGDEVSVDASFGVSWDGLGA